MSGARPPASPAVPSASTPSASTSGNNISTNQTTGSTGKPVSSTPTGSATGTAVGKPQGTLTITSPVGTVYPYLDDVRDYLQDKNANVADYLKKSVYKSQGQEVVISWKSTVQFVDRFTVEYGTKADFSDAIKVTTAGEVFQISVQNLYKATTYYLRVTASTKKGDVVTTTTFQTADLGPRVMIVDGIYNVRDLGGYMTESGQRTKQGLIYRGGSADGIHNQYPTALTMLGMKTVLNDMKIVYELDLRQMGEDGRDGTVSALPGATTALYSLLGINDHAPIREVFGALANQANYPIYLHCKGGADRTGMISYLLNSLLGVSEADLVHDYELTSFSSYGERNSKTGDYAKSFGGWVNAIQQYSGKTHAEKTEKFLLDVGVTQAELDNIKAIMLGRTPARILRLRQTFFRAACTEALTASICGNTEEISQVLINGKSVKFTLIPGGFRVATKEFFTSSAPEKSAVAVTFKDNQILTANFTMDTTPAVEGSTLLSSHNLSTSTKKVTDYVKSSTAVGYGKYVRLRLQAQNKEHGDVRVYIGSYGVQLRGNLIRMWSLSTKGRQTEYDRNQYSSSVMGQKDLEKGDRILYVMVKPRDKTTVEIHYFLVDRNTGAEVASGFQAVPRITDEYASDQAALRVEIDWRDGGGSDGLTIIQ